MLDAEFINRILDISRPEIINNGERNLSTGKLYPVLEPQADRILVHTLTGLLDFYPTIDTPDAMVIIEDFNKVSIVSELFGAERQRESYISAEAFKVDHRFGQQMDQEEFIVYLQSRFVPDNTTATILKIVGNLRSEASGHFSDDGISQTVSTKTGIARVENIELPNPVELRPFRTFTDIDQPASKFVLRMKKGDGGVPKIALHEADGGAWKNDAIENIRDFLAKGLPGVKIIA